MELIGGVGVGEEEEQCLRRGEENWKCNTCTNAITFHALIITIIFLIEGREVKGTVNERVN